jgi:hypothetical protein
VQNGTITASSAAPDGYHVGGAWRTLTFPSTGSGWGTITTTVSLHAGYNVIRLAMGSPFFAGGSGTVNLGYIQLSYCAGQHAASGLNRRPGLAGRAMR